MYNFKVIHYANRITLCFLLKTTEVMVFERFGLIEDALLE